MGVEISKNKKSGTLHCDADDCSVQSGSYPVRSQAAPDLTICEQAGKDGWGYNIGFFAMLLGHTVFCPECSKKSKWVDSPPKG